MFHACFIMIGSWKGGKQFKVGSFWSKNLLGSGYRKQTTLGLGCNRGYKKSNMYFHHNYN